MSDYKVTVKIQNNNILKIIESRGYKSCMQFCKESGFGYATLCKLINMKITPLRKNGELLESALDLSIILSCTIEELFSENQMEKALESNKRTFEVKEAELKFMLQSRDSQKSIEHLVEEEEMDKRIYNMLEILTPREQCVIAMRFGLGGEEESTLDDCKKVLGVTSREGIRKIEANALRKIRASRITREMWADM